uniref:RB-associated KRAB zinc finger protein-like n=1 Tax=Styela clava TaxID=7725 RepID=UPI0019394D23|nr:RB-associated KRAB zinc finger protein-like [Styela clava]
MIFPSQKDHCFDLLSKIFGMLNDPSLCDVSISIEGTVFWAHRCVLIAACPTLFDIIVKESENSKKKIVQLSLQGFSVSGFNAFLLYVYTGQPPDVNDESLMHDFVKSCCALGVSIPPNKENKDYYDKMEQLHKDTEIVMEVTDVSYDKNNESEVAAESDDDDHAESPVDLSVNDIFENLNTADEVDKDLHDENVLPENDNIGGEDKAKHQEEPAKKDVKLQSLFSVKRRDGEDDVASEYTLLISKYPIKQKRKRPVVKHNPILPAEPPFACPFNSCGKIFETFDKLKRHYYIHREKKHICNVCGRKFLLKIDLTIHCRIHTGEKPYACTECGAKFTQKSTWKNHLPTHMNDAPKFPCNLCDKTYTSARSLSLHKKEKHTDKKCSPICHNCNKSFESRAAYISHMKKECDSCNFRCTKCDKRYHMKKSYELHVKKCSVSFDHQCHLCDRAFKNKKQLSTHKFNFHTTPKYNTRTDNVSTASIEVLIDSNEVETNGKNEMYDFDSVILEEVVDET